MWKRKWKTTLSHGWNNSNRKAIVILNYKNRTETRWQTGWRIDDRICTISQRWKRNTIIIHKLSRISEQGDGRAAI